MPYKLDVEVEMPDELDLSCLKSNGGPQEGEVLMQDEAKNIPSKVINKYLVSIEITCKLKIVFLADCDPRLINCCPTC